MRIIVLISTSILALGASGLLASSTLADEGQQKARSEAVGQIEKAADETPTPPVEAAPPANAKGDTEATPAGEAGQQEGKTESDAN